MRPSIFAAILLVIIQCTDTFGQIDLSFSTAKSFVGLTAPANESAPRLLADRILVGEDSKPSLVPVAIVRVNSASRILFTVRKSLTECVEFTTLTVDKEYLVVGPGIFVVEVVNSDLEFKTLQLKIGETLPTPNPIPVPVPGPIPVPGPTPGPVPPDLFDNLGQRVASWSVGFPKKVEVAALYRTASKRLREDQTVTVNLVSADIVASRTTILGTDIQVYQPLIDKLNVDMRARPPMSKGVFADFFSCIATGLEAK